MDAGVVLQFWFEDLSPKEKFQKNPELDERIRQKFDAVHHAACRGELFRWRVTPTGRLAEIIVLDQLTRNMFRDDPRAFAYDSLALVLAQEAVHQGADQDIPISQRSFLYMPYMHSESPVIHEEAVKLFSTEGLSANLDYELRHKAIVDRFGRYPHRNAILGRESTPEELEFLKQPGSRF